MANEKKPEGPSTEQAGATKRPAVGEGVERPVKRTGSVPKWSTGVISNLDEETAAEEKAPLKRQSVPNIKPPAVLPPGAEEKPAEAKKPVSTKQPALTPPADPEKAPLKRQSVPNIKQPVLGAGTEKSLSKRAPPRAGVLPPPPVSTQPAAELPDPNSDTQSLPSPFAAPKAPAAFVPDDVPAKTSTDVPVFLPDPPAPASPFALPKPPAGYKPDDEESERTSTADAVPVAPEPPAGPPTPPPSTGKKPPPPVSENRDGSTVLKRADEIRDPDQPEVSVAKAFQAQKLAPPVEFEEVKTTLKPIADDDDEPTSKPPSPRVADQKTNIKDLAEIEAEAGRPGAFDGKTALVATRASGEIKKTAAAEQKLKEKDGKGVIPDKTRTIPLPDDETTSGAALHPGASGETPLPGAAAVGADGKPLDPKLAGAFSRAQGREAGKEPMGKVTGAMKPPLTRDQKIAVGVVAGGALLILVILVTSLVGFKDRPTPEDLERCYPYGQNGSNGPNGLRAPPVALVKFKFDQDLEVPVSTDYEKCVVVKYEGPGANATTPFQGSMVMCKRWDKIWKRGNDDGMPFRIAE